MDEMAEQDPQEYQRFLERQTEQAHEEELRAKGFFPTAGFVIKSYERPAGSAKEAKCVEKKVFVNCCSYEKVQRPSTHVGRPVEQRPASTDGITLPLVVGPLRRAK